MNIYFHIDEMNRDAIVASAFNEFAKSKGWRIVFGNRQLSEWLPRFERFFDIVVLPKPHFFTGYFAKDEIENLKSKYVMLYTEQIGIMTSEDFPKLALRQMLDKEFMSGDKQYVDKVSAFCFWSNQAKSIVLQNFPELESKCYVVGHPRHDSRANPLLRGTPTSTNKNIGILTRSVLLNDYFGRHPLQSVYENSQNIQRGGMIEYENTTSGDYFVSQIRGVNPKNDIFLESIDFESTMFITERLEELGYKISLRVHPKEDIKFYERLYARKHASISIVPADIPFAFWAQTQRFLIGPPSTSFYDAFLLGVLPISTSEINEKRKDFVPLMYEDNNQLMSLVKKPKSLEELVTFVESISDKEYHESVRHPKILQILEREVNYPFHTESLGRFVKVIEKLLLGEKRYRRKNFGVLVFLLVANISSELKFPYFLLKERLTGSKLLNSANFVMNFSNRHKIRNFASRLHKYADL
jgi:hypothetical protein